MRKCTSLITGLIVFLTGQFATAQQGNSFREVLRSLSDDPALESLVPPETGTIKCGTPYRLAIHSRWNSLTPQSRARLMQVMQRPTLQTSKLSPSGRFRVHFDTTNINFNQPALIAAGQDVPNSYNAYIDSVMAILDHVWTYEIDTLGYGPPLHDGSEGGGPEYDVYVQELGTYLFGYTDWDPNDPASIVNGGNRRYPTYMVIDNDFLGMRTPGMDGLKVTCAHEFHHAIQIGSYGMWTENDFYFNELTSSWMEDVVYTQVNDYYYDVERYFSTANAQPGVPSGFRDTQGYPLSFTYYNPSTYGGYERSIFGHFLAKRYGRDMMKEIWQGISIEPFLLSARDAFARRASNWNTEFALFTYWNYFTGDRADTVRFYSEGNHYPRFDPNITADFSSNTNTCSISSGGYPLSSGMYEFHLLRQQDTVTAIAANVELDAALAGDNAVRQLQLELTKGVLSIPHVTLANGYNAGIANTDPNKWRIFYTLSSTRSDIVKLNLQASPNPLRLSDASQLLLPLNGASATKANVYFLSSSLTLQYSAQFDVENQFGNQYIAVPTSQLRSRLTSGIYFVVAKIADGEFTWKIAVIR